MTPDRECSREAMMQQYRHVRRSLRVGMAAACLVVVLVPPAQAQGRRARKSSPPPASTLPEGWVARLDPQEEKRGRTLAEVTLEGDSLALHVAGGPAVTLWNNAYHAEGRFMVWGSFTQTRATTPPGGYGPFIGGTSLDGKEYNYLYCAVHGNGAYSIKHRFGGELHTLVERRVSGAIRPADASGKASNAIGWLVDETNVACVINGTSVSTFPRTLLLGPGKLESIDGIFGLHVDRDVDVRITEFGVKH
ncbi:MAG: hypothetical protein IT359_02610 [Gemmatimonadaceae bacterium]|nr:hypothetical protein [Gemmatimonadaceae bacterium]